MRYEQQQLKVSPSDVISAMAFTNFSANDESAQKEYILSIDELKQLDTALAQNEELISSKNLAMGQRPLLNFSFILGSMNLSLRTSRPIASLSLEGIETSYSMAYGGELSLTTAIKKIVALDKVTPNTLFKNNL